MRTLRVSLMSLSLRGLVLLIGSLSTLGAGTVRGKVTLKSNGQSLHHATVLLSQLGRTAETTDDGSYEFRDVPAGSYDILSRLQALSDQTRRVEVTATGVSTVDFALSIQSLRQEVTVTATGLETTTIDAFQSVVSIPGHEVVHRANSPSLGDLLEHEPGIAKRSFGPGTARPVVRGFDGDRVLVLQDGTRTGTLSSQSGDHGEPVDPLALERVEVIRGPAILLYGNNAIGGVVNVITDQGKLRQADQDGLHGSITGQGGTNNGQAGGSANFHFTRGGWNLRGGGGGLRTGNYSAPQIGEIDNSQTDMRNARIGGSKVGERGFLSVDFGSQTGGYGVPFANVFEGDPDGEGIHLDWRRYNTRVAGGLQKLGPALESFDFYVNHSDWNHKELEGDEVGTRFFNDQLTYQGVFRQARRGMLSGSFGAWGMKRNFETIGEESLAPPVDQNAFAVFGVEELRFERFRMQLGARVERNSYEAPGRRSRDFTGVSASAGINVPLGAGTALVGNYTHSYRAPALEELYNLGPHIGNVTFEVGNQNLSAERGNGVELSLRHQTSRFRAEANTFYYRMQNFIYLAPTGNIEDGLPEADYSQADARYMGAEARLDAGLTSNLWLNLGFDVVDAQTRISRTPLPRIPPVRGRVGLDFRYGGFSVRPEVHLANAQYQLFPNETRTAGYAVLNTTALYTLTRKHTIHTFGATLFNAGDRLYRNHLSFIKDFAPEIGRGARFSYTLTMF